jgi:serine/threonine protein kinase
MDIKLDVKKIGKGSYGKVYGGVMGDGQTVAVKSIELEDDIPSLLEASILTCFKHPALLSAKFIFTDEEHLHIVMDKATCDLSRVVRLDKGGSLQDLDTIRKWSYSLACGVHALHSHQIIHCDIKSSNVLVFDNEVRLADFGLACIGRYSRKYDICTVTHRPLEVLFRHHWNKSVDIWSLACTIYEMAFGSLLFPYQAEDLQDLPSTVFRKTLRDKTINCVLDWASSYPDWNILYRNNVSYQKHHHSHLWNHSDYAQLKDLLIGMLHPDNRKRLTIEQVLSHEFFTGLTPVSYHVSFDSTRFTLETIVQNLKTKCPEVEDEICDQIARQMIRFDPERDFISDVKTVKELCERLSFQLL